MQAISSAVVNKFLNDTKKSTTVERDAKERKQYFYYDKELGITSDQGIRIRDTWGTDDLVVSKNQLYSMTSNAEQMVETMNDEMKKEKKS